MQRQSLGSPVSKLHGSGAGAKGDALVVEDEKRSKHAPSSSSIADHCEKDDDKAAKSYRLSFSSPSTPRPEKFVHAIPILTVICFLILYLCSHSPSQSDLAQFRGFKRLPKHSASAEMKADIGQFMEQRKGSILAIQSLRNLKEIEKSYPPKFRTPRKVANL